MTTFKGAMRSYAAASRRMERDRQRRAREAAKRFKEQQKVQLIENARQAVEDYQEYINVLLSVHKECDSPVEWTEIYNAKEPEVPQMKTEYTDRAKLNLVSYNPNLFDKLFGLSKKKIKQLEDSIVSSSELDKAAHERALEKHKEDVANHYELRAIAEGIKKNDKKCFIDALRFFNAFDDFSEIGSQLSFEFNNDMLDVELNINSLEIIPDYELSQTSTGKLSKKGMAKGKFNELYQDHVCSSVIRVAREVFSYLPLEHVRINAMAQLLNVKTGHLEQAPVLSVIVSSKTLGSLNLDTIDPSESMSNFVHNMNFKKTVGFSAVQKAVLN